MPWKVDLAVSTSRSQGPLHLVVHLEFGQCSVLLHRFNHFHHPRTGDEVGLDVEALKGLVLCQHFGHSLEQQPRLGTMKT